MKFIQPLSCVMGIALAAAISSAVHAGGQTIHVPADYLTIQEAIDAATGGDEIVVAPGTHNEAINFLGKAIRVRSSHGAEETIIDATGIAPPDETVSVVTFASGETRDAILEGFTITGGSGTNAPFGYGIMGGGIYIEQSSPTVLNCVITGNTARYGGGLAAFRSGAVPLIENCHFVQNHAEGTPVTTSGGGAIVWGCTAHFIGCVFEENSAWNGGGLTAIGNLIDGAVVVENSQFLKNVADNGGGAVEVNNEGDAVFNACRFEGNSAAGGGAVYLLGEFPSFPITPAQGTFENCDFVENTATFMGGGIAHFGQSLFVENCTFEGNIGSGEGGGGIAAWSTLDAIVNITVNNSTFTGNAASNGGAILNSLAPGGNATLTESIFTSNSAGNVGGAIASKRGALTLQHSTLASNTAGEKGGAIRHEVGITHVVNSTISDNSANAGGGASASASGLRFEEAFFCNNAPTHIQGAWLDLGGNEFFDVCPTNPGDLDGNGIVNVFDLLILLAAWGDCPPPQEDDCPADFDGNGVVNVFDLLFLLANWG